MTLEELIAVIQERKNTLPTDSYIASLFREGPDRIIQKVGEEAVEVVIAAKNDNRQRCIEEMSDLLFMFSILLVEKKITYEELFEELQRRSKKKRNKKPANRSMTDF